MKEDYQKPEMQEMDSALFFPVVHGGSNNNDETIDPGANGDIVDGWN